MSYLLKHGMLVKVWIIGDDFEIHLKNRNRKFNLEVTVGLISNIRQQSVSDCGQFVSFFRFSCQHFSKHAKKCNVSVICIFSHIFQNR